MKIGERIRAARKKAGMTQKQLGEACGIAEPTIRRYELGKLNPKPETLEKIAAPLGLRWYELYSDSIDEQTKAIHNIITSDIASNKPDIDEFIEMLQSPILQKIGARWMEKSEKERMQACQKNGVIFIPFEEPFYSEAIRAHLSTLLVDNGIYPSGYKSLLNAGFSQGDAFAIMDGCQFSIPFDTLSVKQSSNFDNICKSLDITESHSEE